MEEYLLNKGIWATWVLSMSPVIIILLTLDTNISVNWLLLNG